MLKMSQRLRLQRQLLFRTRYKHLRLQEAGQAITFKNNTVISIVMVRARTKVRARVVDKVRDKDLVWDVDNMARAQAMARDVDKARDRGMVMPEEDRDPGMARAWVKSVDTAEAPAQDHAMVSLTTNSLEMPREEQATVLAEAVLRTR